MIVSINFTPSDELEKIIKEEAIQHAREMLLNDKQELRKMIQDSVKGTLRANINELLQGKDFRDFLRDKIMQEIGMTDVCSESKRKDS